MARATRRIRRERTGLRIAIDDEVELTDLASNAAFSFPLPAKTSILSTLGPVLDSRPSKYAFKSLCRKV